MHITRHASAIAGDTTRVERIAVATTIDAMTIDAVMPTVDQDATDATDVTIDLFAATAMLEVIVGCNATALNVEWCW